MIDDRQIIRADIADDLPLVIQNHGARVVASNYWQTKLAQSGMTFLTINAGAFRLLVPEAYRGSVKDMATASVVVVSQPEQPGRWHTELLFDDYTESPFSIHLGDNQTDRILPKRNVEAKFHVYTEDEGKAVLALERPAVFRIVPKLPWLKSLDNVHWAQFSRRTLKGR